MQATPMFAVHTFLLEQYLHPSIEDANPRSGDYAVDGGAFWGDTALWLAERCGPDGLITAFEMGPANARVLEPSRPPRQSRWRAWCHAVRGAAGFRAMRFRELKTLRKSFAGASFVATGRVGIQKTSGMAALL